jgi:O-antigen/teichoic acid export membrane protein
MTVGKMWRLLMGSVGSRFAGAGISLTTQLVLTRSFPAADVGILFLTMSMAAIMSLVVTGGYPSLALTQIPRFHALGLNRLNSAFHGAFLRDWTSLSALIFLGTTVAVLFLPLDRSLRLALIFGCLTSTALALIRYNSAIANTSRRYSLAYVPDFLYRPGLFFAYVTAAYFLGYKLSLSHVLWVFVAANSIVAAAQAFIIRHEGLQLSNWGMTSSRLTSALRHRAVALAIVAGVSTMFADVVTLIGGFLLPHEQVAMLGLMVRLAGIAGYVVHSSQQFVLSDLTQAITLRDQSVANTLLLRMNLLTITTLACGLLGVVVFGGYFLGVFGEVYVQGHWLLVLFICGQSIRALSGMNQHLLSIGGYQLRSALASLVGILVLFASWVLLQRLFGMIGVGLAVILAELTWAIMLGAQAQTLTKRRGDIFWLLAHRN